MKKISLFILAIMLTITSCKNYDDDFKDLNKSIAELQAQVAGFSSLQAGITALQSSVASLQTTVNALPTTQVDLSGLEADLAAALANIASLQADLNTVIANYATSTDLSTAQASIDALTTALAAAQADLDELLAANNVYTGDLNIRNAAELSFAQSLSADLSIINGNVRINNTAISAAAVSAITSGIISVTGFVDVVSVASVDLSSLVSVGTTYSVVGVDIADQALTNVGTSVNLDYRGPYSQPNLVSAPTVTFAPKAVSGTLAVTSAIDFSGLTSGVVNSGTITVPEATSVKLNVINAAGVSTVTAAKALTVDMLAADYRNGLTVDAQKAGSAITITGNMFSGTTYGDLAVTGSATSSLVAAALTKAGDITVTTIATALSFPALTSAAVVSAPATVSFSAPLLVATSVAVGAAKTVNIATANLTAGIVENLTFTALDESYTAATTLKTATVTGKVGGAGAFTSTSAVLTSATFAGELDAVSVTGGTLLTSLSTTGAIDSFTLGTSPIITAVSLGHSHIAGGAGSELTINGNAELASLTTSTDKLKTLIVTGNAKLAAMNFASYTSVIAAGTITVTITGNKLSGDYTAAVAAGANPYVETTIASADLVTLKPFVAAYKAAKFASTPTTTATIALSVDLWDVEPTTGVQTLAAAQGADTAYLAVHTAWNAVGTLASAANNVDEFLLIQ